jgi:hypothetical protein
MYLYKYRLPMANYNIFPTQLEPGARSEINSNMHLFVPKSISQQESFPRVFILSLLNLPVHFMICCTHHCTPGSCQVKLKLIQGNGLHLW